MYRVELLDAAVRDLASLDKLAARRITKRIQWLAENFEQLQPISCVVSFRTFISSELAIIVFFNLSCG